MHAGRGQQSLLQPALPPEAGDDCEERQSGSLDHISPQEAVVNQEGSVFAAKGIHMQAEDVTCLNMLGKSVFR